ncbi:MAG: hypothetical protein H7Z43_05280 [Clostridia bacterium]|nr:hypothetical protein [Deltaproteobacteria bacterium]
MIRVRSVGVHYRLRNVEMPSRRPSLRGTHALYAAPTPHVIVGLAHVVVGALRVLYFMLITLFTNASQVLSPASIVIAAIAGGTVLGGLWLADGRRRGAAVTLMVDLALVGVLFVRQQPNSALDLFVNTALAVGVVWVLPRLAVEREADARLTRVAADKPTGD